MTSTLSSYLPVPSSSEVAFGPSANRGLPTTGPFLQRPPTPGVDIVNKSILLSEAQRIPAVEARDRGLFTVFHNEQDLKGLCFLGVVARGGCPVPDCKFCKQSSKLLFERNADSNADACERAALRVVGHSVAPSAKVDDGDRGRDRSRSRDRDSGRDRSASRDRGGGGGDRRGRSPSAGRH